MTLYCYIHRECVRSCMHCIGCVVDHIMVVFSSEMAMNVGDSAFDLSTNASSSDSECELSSPLADNTDRTNVVGVFVDTSSNESFEVHKQSHHSRDNHNGIPLCADFGREHWVGLDVVLLNDLGVPMANGICRNSDPHECVAANPLVSMVSACAS